MLAKGTIEYKPLLCIGSFLIAALAKKMRSISLFVFYRIFWELSIAKYSIIFLKTQSFSLEGAQ